MGMNGISAAELAFAFEPDTYTTSGNIWRIRCPSSEHGWPLVIPMEQRDIGNAVVGDGENYIWAKCWSKGCSSKSIISALRAHKEWFDRISKNPKPLLFAQQNGECAACGNKFSESQLQVDHVMPRSKGGKSHIYNYTLLCGVCNSTKGNTI